MKKLTRLLLINWHYFQHQVIDFGTINFLTGRNSVGKSTIIDAFQVAVLGEIRNDAFNGAARNNTERTLMGYLLGSLGEDINNGKKSIRAGKNFSSYIVAEFYDDMKDDYFCTGAVFDVFADGSDRKRFFWIRSQIPAHHFIIENKTMDSRTVTKWFDENLPNRYETKDTAKAYRQLLLQKYNVHEDKFFSMMKKAISFKPITDIEKFITENVCDVEDDIDIRAMQENILYYSQQEKLARVCEEKIESLNEINQQYQEVEKLYSIRTVQKFMIDYGEWNTILEQLDTAQTELQNIETKISELEEKHSALNRENEKLKLKSEDLNEEIRTYKNDSKYDSLKNEKDTVSREIKEIEKQTDDFIISIRTQSLKWYEIFDACSTSVSDISLQDNLKKLMSKIKAIMNLEAIDLENYSSNWFLKLREEYHFIFKQIDPVKHALQQELNVQQENEKELNNEIEHLKKGMKAYPQMAVRLKDAISVGLKNKYNENIKVDFLSDVIDITDESWRNAVEGYLNIQRMNIIVPPKYFMDAYDIYRSIQFKEKIHGFAVVDLERVYNDQPEFKENSLYDVVTTNDKYVRSYMIYLLGKVIRCERDEDLRKHRISVTKDCMQYSGYAVKAMDQNAYATPYIGRDSIQKQIKSKTLELTKVKLEIEDVKEKLANIKPVAEKEWFLTEEYINSTVAEVLNKHNLLSELNLKLDNINEAMGKIDLLWIDEKQKEIKQIESQMENIIREMRITDRQHGQFDEKKKQIAESTIPGLEQRRHELNDFISSTYSEEVRSITGISGYESELKKHGSAKRVVEMSKSALNKTKEKIKNAEDKLITLRGDYNNKHHTSFVIAEVNTNSEFEKEYQKISEYELPNYRKEIERAKQDAMDQFKHDFIYRLRNNINNAYNKIDELNDALRKFKFGNDTYRFEIKPDPAYREYYDMIMSESLEFGANGLFGLDFLQHYQTTIDNLFSQILSLSDDDTGITAQNVEKFSKYKTYLTFDLLSTDDNGRTDRLSKSINIKSGGESQTPFYIAVLASFAQLYRTHDSSDFGNTIRLVIFDEAFNRMDDERIIESVKLLRRFDLQAIVCTPPDKASDLLPVSDKTLLVDKQSNGKIYQSVVLEWSKEIEEAYGL